VTFQPNKTKKQLAEKILRHTREISDWYLDHAKRAPAPFYCSVDLRDAGYKITPVDSNLFPAGFNNICPEDQRTAPPVLRAQIEAHFSRAGMHRPSRVLVLPESHAQNLNYAENLLNLIALLKAAGFETELGWYGTLPAGAPPEGVPLKTASGKELLARPIRVDGRELSAGPFVPELIILNNDFSSGRPGELDSVGQPILPTHHLGWHSRKKTDHFVHYNRLAAEFARLVDVDPWILQIDTEEVAGVSFAEDRGIEEVAQAAERVLGRTRAAYQAHDVKGREPFVYVKNNAGTYGMGIMVVRSAEEIRLMNRRSKNKMSVGKNKLQISSVAVQEGVPTATMVDRLAAEPVIYLSGTELIGGFLRTNTEKGDEDNLNSQGMVFRKLCMSDLRIPEEDLAEEKGIKPPILELVYGSIARISALAAGYEIAGRA
jgi:glutamate--cysteine ligase